MNTVTCETQSKSLHYDITIGSSLLSRCGELLPFSVKGKKIAVISDSTVAPLYADKLVAALQNSEVCVFAFPAGEESKNFKTINDIYDFLCRRNFTRDDMMIALGGGVVGDMCGFAAATYLRGIPFIQIPTTLLADVDSSVGGKTGYDLPYGKNLVGAFYQPKAVIIDTDLLRTLDKSTYADGMAEVIKTALLSDRDMFDMISDKKLDEENTIIRCVHFKSSIVSADETDKGIRGILNLGHTFGHAIEKIGEFKKHTHGQAVAIGTVIACRVGELLGITKSGTASLAVTAFENHCLPTASPYSADEIADALINDKKADATGVKIVLLKDIGVPLLHHVSFDELRELLKQII